MRLIDADALKEDFKTRLEKAKNWKENALNNSDDELVIRATATIDFICEVIMTINNAPTIELNDKSLEIARKSIELGRNVGKLEGKLERTPGDLISRSEAEKLGATCLARRNENGQLEAIISLDNAPTVEPDCLHCKQYQGGYDYGFNIGYNKGKKERPQGEWIHPYTTNIACECSNCHMQMPITDYYNFCPNCGAWMGGGAE